MVPFMLIYEEIKIAIFSSDSSSYIYKISGIKRSLSTPLSYSRTCD